MAPKLNRLLETVLVVADLPRACAFYRETLALEPLGEPSDRGCLFLLPGGQLLGLVDEEAAREPNETEGGVVPPCTPDGAVAGPPSTHLAFAVSASGLDAWRDWLERRGVAVVGEVEWERGGHSLYFRDPDGHLLELATPGVWEFY